MLIEVDPVDRVEAPDVECLVQEIRRAAGDADGAALEIARALDLIDRTGAHREAGHAMLGDLIDRLGLSPRRARELLDLGRAMRRYEGLEDAIRGRRIGLSRAVLAAAAMAESRLPLGDWIREIRNRDVASLRAFVRRERGSRVVSGRRVQRELVDLSVEGRAMLFDAQAFVSRARAAAEGGPGPQTTMGRNDVMTKAVDLALLRLDEGASVGERRFRIAEHAPGSFAIVHGRVDGAAVLLRAERASFDLVLRPPEDARAVLERLRVRHGISSDDPLAIVEAALAAGGPGEAILESEERPLAQVLVEEIRAAISTEREAWHRVARILVVLEDLEVPGWRERVAAEIDRSRSVVSELLACGRVAKRFPLLGEAFEAGIVTWTQLRTLAPYLDDANFQVLAPIILECNVRELEQLRAALQPRGRSWEPRARARKRGGVAPLEFELTSFGWERIEILARKLSTRLGRAVGVVEAMEEALWQFCVSGGSPSPLWSAYRILVHHDRGTGASWVVVPGGIVQVGEAEMTRIRSSDAVVCDVGDEVEAVRRREVDRLARTLAGNLTEEEDILEALRVALSIPGRAPAASEFVRRAVYLRDGCRCSVCGCRAAIYVQVHHLRPRADGGGNDPENLALLCSRCHALTHSEYAELVARERRSVLFFRLGADGSKSEEAADRGEASGEARRRGLDEPRFARPGPSLSPGHSEARRSWPQAAAIASPLWRRTVIGTPDRSRMRAKASTSAGSGVS